jgi:hypothetical protein
MNGASDDPVLANGYGRAVTVGMMAFKKGFSGLGKLHFTMFDRLEAYINAKILRFLQHPTARYAPFFAPDPR